MPIIIKLQGLPLEAKSVDVRRYFLGLTIPDGGVHIVGGDEGTVFIEFASDEDARQAMARGDGNIKNSCIKLLLSSQTEMQSVIEAARLKQQQYLQQQQQQLLLQQQQQQQHQQQQQLHQQQQQQQQYQPSAFIDPRILSQSYQGIMSNLNQYHPQPLLPQPSQQIFNQFVPVTTANSTNLGLNLLGSIGLVGAVGGNGGGGGGMIGGGGGGGGGGGNEVASNVGANVRNHSPARMSGMRGGDDKLFANKKCVLAASNIPYRATSKDIIEFFSEFNINEDCIRRRYNQKGQPTADAKIAFPTPDAAIKALKIMNKKTLCSRQVFLKPV